MQRVPKIIRKTGITILGFLLLLTGLILLILPGPGLMVIILGLLVLSWEYEWAKHHLHRAQNVHKKAMTKIQNKNDRDKNT